MSALRDRLAKLAFATFERGRDLSDRDLARLVRETWREHDGVFGHYPYRVWREEVRRLELASRRRLRRRQRIVVEQLGKLKARTSRTKVNA